MATPTDLGRLGRLITEAADRGTTVKAVGAGHSFSAIAATDGVQVRLDALAGVRRVDRDTGLVTVGGGTRLADLNLVLASYGLALPNLGDIDRQTVAGAISTGTHGSGNRLGGLATQVRGLTLVTGDGSCCGARPTRTPTLLAAAAVGLGALGIVVEVTLQCVPTFLLRAEEGSARLAEVLEQWPTWTAENDHVDLHWFPHTDWVLTKRNNRVDGPPRAAVGLAPAGRRRAAGQRTARADQRGRHPAAGVAAADQRVRGADPESAHLHRPLGRGVRLPAAGPFRGE